MIQLILNLKSAINITDLKLTSIFDNTIQLDSIFDDNYEMKSSIDTVLPCTSNYDIETTREE